MSNTSAQYVHYGCGITAPDGWTNFDVSPTLRLQRLPFVGKGLLQYFKRPIFPDNVRYGDVVSGLPIDAQSCQGIYCSHVLEHLTLEDCRIALRNTFGYLQPGGIFRMVLPDMKFIAQKYVDAQSPTASHDFMKDAHLGRKVRRRTPVGMLIDAFGNSIHLWMWDFESLSIELENVGFQSVRRAQFNDSADDRFLEVEEFGRWENCLGIECVRPD